MDLKLTTSSNSDEISSLISEQLNKIEQLKDFLSLHFRRDKLLPELKELQNRMPKIQEQLEECNTLLDNYKTNIVNEYNKLMDKMRKQQMAMLYLLTEIEKKNQSATTKVITPVSHFKLKNNQLETPRLYLSEYKQSPYISKIRPITLQFIDFEANLTVEQFAEIPKYMRGRETFDELNTCLQTIIIPCFTEKYQLLHRKREFVRNPHEMKLWKIYHEQISYFPGQKFITQGDISHKLNKFVDKKMCSRIAMLRHLRILQEQRKESVVCYIWLATNYAETD